MRNLSNPNVHKYVTKNIPAGFVMLLFALLYLVYAFPFWTGDVIYPGGKYIPSHRIQVPSYYSDATNWISNQGKEFRIVSLPPAFWGCTAYAWEHGYADGPMDQSFFPYHPIIDHKCGYIYADEIYDLINTLFLNKLLNCSIGKILSLFNVKYILVHYDWNTNYTGGLSPEYFAQILEAQKDIRLENIFGALNFYKNEYWRPLQIYATPNAILVNGSLNEMFYVVGREDFTVGENILFLLDQFTLNQLAKLPKGIVKYSPNKVNIQVYDGWTNRVNWFSTFANISYAARYYPGWKGVISTNGIGDPDMLIFPSLENCPYIFPSFSSDYWGAFSSTLVYIVTNDKPLKIYSVLTDNKPTTDIVGVWWETGWMGMTTKAISFPIVIPAHQRAIIQISHKADTVTLITEPHEFTIPRGQCPAIVYEEINPTKYVIHISNISEPFFLVFSESYHEDWRAYVGKLNWFTALFEKPISNEYHFIANGYANAWYIDPQEIDKNGDRCLTITLYYLPQSLFYVGLIISSLTFIVCISYLLYDWKSQKRILNEA
jgi:hypothetical protein